LYILNAAFSASFAVLNPVITEGSGPCSAIPPRLKTEALIEYGIAIFVFGVMIATQD
jgi:hypothetical protein